MNKLQGWFMQLFINWFTKQLLKLAERVMFALADYFDAMTVKLQKEQEARDVLPVSTDDLVRAGAAVVAKLA